MMRNKRLKILVALLTLTTSWLILAGPAQAAVTADIAPKAKLLGAGESAVGSVTISCDAGLQVVDATYSLQQGGTDGVTHIEGVVCDGKPHRYRVTVTTRAGSGSFQEGDAFAVAVVHAQDPQTGGSQHIEVGAIVTLH
jgi:hypothetical protein